MFIKIEVNISRTRQIYINKCIIQPNQTSKSTNRYNCYFDISSLYDIIHKISVSNALHSVKCALIHIQQNMQLSIQLKHFIYHA